MSLLLLYLHARFGLFVRAQFNYFSFPLVPDVMFDQKYKSVVAGGMTILLEKEWASIKARGVQTRRGKRGREKEEDPPQKKEEKKMKH